MARSFALLLGILIFTTLIAACASMNTSTAKRAVCNTLKSDLVFNGATSDTRAAEFQNAEKPLQQHTYDRDNC